MAPSAPKKQAKSAAKAVRAKAKPAKSAKAARRGKPAKAPAKSSKARKAPGRKVQARKAPGKGSAALAHAAKMKEVRQRVARRRPGMAPRVDPAQQDPSIIPPPQPPMAPVDHLHENYGDAKARSVARQDNPTNWFRQAPKAKSK